MSQNTYGQYTPKAFIPLGRGETTPFVELCESVVPHISKAVIPAPWLPIKRYDQWINSGVVISVGTAVGFDKAGYLVPAGIAGGGTITYSQYDVDMGVLRADTGAAVGTANLTVTIPTSLVSNLGAIPVGVATYNIYQHLGGVTFNSWPTYAVDNDNPLNFRMHNTSKEDAVAFTCDYVIEVPWVGTTESSGLSATALSYAHAYGTFELGGPVKVDAKGMFIPASDRTDRLWLGQVLATKSYMKTVGASPAVSEAIGALERVKTAVYADNGTPNVAWQMPGSATKGIPRAIHLATDGAFAAGDTGWNDAGNYTSLIINIQL